MTSRIRAVTVLRARSAWSPSRRARPARTRGLVQQQVPLRPGPGRALGIVPALRFRYLTGQVGHAGPDLAARGRVEHLVRAEAQVGAPGLTRASGRDQVGGRNLAT